MIPLDMIGLEVYNPASTDISDQELVYFSDKHIDRRVPDVAKAQGISGGRFAQAIAKGTISAESYGWVAFYVTIDGHDTSALSEADPIYLDDGTAGNWTTTKPTSTDKVQIVGEVLTVDSSNGVVALNIAASTLQITHTHGDDAEGGQLDIDTALSDIVHDHSAAGEGGQLDVDTAFSDLVHDHTSPAEGGTLAQSTHGHTGAGDGGQIDVDTAFSDFVHDHSAAGEGGQLDIDTAFSDVVHNHSSAAEGGTSVTLSSLTGHVRGYIIYGDASQWGTLDAKTAGHILKGDGSDVVSTTFDWDDIAAAVGADMIHDHSANAEGGNLTAANVNIVDTGGHFTATEVETALDEIHHRLDALENP